MKRAVILTTVVVGGLVAAGVSAQQAPPSPAPGRSPLPGIGKIEKVSANVYKIFGAGGNTTVFVLSDGVVLVDTKLANNGQAILDQVRTVTDKPVTTIINTHVHPDHNGSNGFFKEHRPTVAIVTHENNLKWIAASPIPNPGAQPTQTYKDKLTLGSGKDRVDLYYFGAGHTNGDSFVVYPAEKIMAAGDIMAWNMAPLIDPGSGGSVVALPDTLEKAAKGIRGVDRVVEGHGFVIPWSTFVTFGEFNRALLNESKAALARNDTPESAVEVLEKNPKFAVLLGTSLLPGLEYGNTPKARAHMNVHVAFQELSGERVTTNFGGPLPATDKHKGSTSTITGAGGPPGGGAPRPAPSPTPGQGN